MAATTLGLVTLAEADAGIVMVYEHDAVPMVPWLLVHEAATMSELTPAVAAMPSATPAIAAGLEVKAVPSLTVISIVPLIVAAGGPPRLG